jgi:hypothetical protein
MGVDCFGRSLQQASAVIESLKLRGLVHKEERKKNVLKFGAASMIDRHFQKE